MTLHHSHHLLNDPVSKELGSDGHVKSGIGLAEVQTNRN